MMEETVRLRVDLRNTRFKSAAGIGGVLEKTARLNETWIEFLVNECGIQLQVDAPYFVCNKSYISNPRKQELKSQCDMGWQVALGDKVSDFITKYKRKRSKYTIRLTYGLRPKRGNFERSRAVLGRGVGGESSNRVNATRQVPPVTPGQTPAPMPIYRTATPKNGQGANASKSSSWRDNLMKTVSNDVVVQRDLKDQDSDSEMDSTSDGNLDDALSDGTASNDERAELNADGIQMENLIPRIMENVHRLDNSLCLRVDKEIKRLRASGLWSKQQEMAPFVSIVIEELLRDPQGN